jgi:Putative prokaryotic signal transducing protein
MSSAVVFRTWSDQEAQIVKGILELYGIPVCLETDLSHALYPLTLDGLGEIRVLVPNEAGEEAQTILDGYRARGIAPDA